MKKFKGIATLVLCMTLVLLLASLAKAQDFYKFSVEYEWPTQREDGSVLTPTEIDKLRVYHGDTVAGEILDKAVTQVELDFHLPAGADGCFTMTSFSSDGQESLRSTPFCVDLPKTRPRAPVIIIIIFSKIDDGL